MNRVFSFLVYVWKIKAIQWVELYALYKIADLFGLIIVLTIWQVKSLDVPSHTGYADKTFFAVLGRMA